LNDHRVDRAPSPAPASPDAHAALTCEALCFLMQHPGCLEVGEQRARYAEVYRHFVLALRERHADVTARRLRRRDRASLGTLQDWLRSPPGSSAWPRSP